MKWKLTQYKCLLTALSATILLSGCSSNKESYYVSMPKVEPIPNEDILEKTIDCTIKVVEEIKEKSKVVAITISAVGDCTLGTDTNFGPQNTLPDVFAKQEEDYSYFFKEVYPIVSQDDLSIANLETTLISLENWEAIEKYRVDKKFNFKGPADYTNILAEGSIEAVNLANNHMFDYGEKGYEETKENLEKANIPSFGYDNYKILEIKGLKIGLAGIEGWIEQTAKDNTQKAIDFFKEQETNLIIISYHWGIERESRQNATQENIARFAIDYGADLVLGHHPHVLQGIENYKGKHIVYSLGNFVFGVNKNPSDKDTLIFQETFHFNSGKITTSEIQIIPCSLSGEKDRNNYQPRIVEGEEQTRVRNKILSSSLNVK